MSNRSHIIQKIESSNLSAETLREHLADILEDSRDILYKYNFQTAQYEYLSKSVEAFTGYTHQEVLEKSAELILNNLHPEDRDEFIRLYTSLKDNTFEGSEFIHEYRYRHKDGTYRWRSDSVNVQRDEEGNIISIFGSTRDITDQKVLQQHLVEQEQRYKELYQNAKVALFRTRISDGQLLECNQALVDLFGYNSFEECINVHRSIEHYVQPERRRELLSQLQQNRRVNNFQLQMRQVDGTIKWVAATVVAFPDRGHLEGALYDITASKILTKTEKKVLKIVLEGKSNKEIAHILHRSVRTIEDHRAHIMRKLGANNLIELAQKAYKLGLETPSD